MPSAVEIDRAAKRREQVVEIIRRSVADRGYPPTVSELAAETAVSPRQVRKDLDTLVESGAIERDAGEARGLRIVYR